MENKQDVILSLMRAMLELMNQLTYVSPNSNNEGLMPLIHSVRVSLDEFLSVFMDDGEIRDSETMIDDLTEEINFNEYSTTSEPRLQPFDIKPILRHRGKIRAIWRMQDKEAKSEGIPF